ncbi:transglutaminase N-terminal domain-containing protein [Methylopila musalis]|uniref:Transglutaminase N-terminal domain-containing protein n=1 Tax=Methylopila musalis TaxID=1134781 RepID=A0ABW3Z847_9HYPH
MIYDITLKIAYDYPDQVKDARHILRVRPSQEPSQTVWGAEIDISPRPGERVLDQDFFGNTLDHVLLFQPHQALKITMRSRVEIHRAAPDLEATPTVAEIVRAAFASRDVSGRGPMHYLGDSRIAHASEAMTAYARKHVAMDAPIGVAMLAFAKAITKEFAYKPGATTVNTPVDEAFAARKGVCQDFAHIMISALRGIGVPAAYVSGFLRTIPPAGRPRLEGADAMHAWVKVWLGDQLGWRGFDPTNAMATRDDHIVVAVGRDYSDVAPIDGVLITAGPQKTRHTVDVIPLGEPQPVPAPDADKAEATEDEAAEAVAEAEAKDDAEAAPAAIQAPPTAPGLPAAKA